MLGEVFEEDKVEFASLLAVIREKNKDIYTSLLCETLANQKLSDYGKSLFAECEGHGNVCISM